jgi:DNA primase
MAAVRDPSIIDDSIEQVGARGFGDDKLDALAREIVQLRYEAESLDMDGAMRRLRARGVGDDLLAKLERDARRAGVAAPFMDPTAARERARDLWRQAFDLLMRLESLERAVEAAARDLDRDHDSSTLMTLKTERDLLRRLVNSDWSNADAEAVVLPH